MRSAPAWPHGRLVTGYGRSVRLYGMVEGAFSSEKLGLLRDQTLNLARPGSPPPALQVFGTSEAIKKPADLAGMMVSEVVGGGISRR